MNKKDLMDILVEVDDYLHWNAGDLCGDDLMGDEKRTKRYEQILELVYNAQVILMKEKLIKSREENE